MILSFKEKFVHKILSGNKIHTIREDKSNRWNSDCDIHFATGVRTKRYNQFYGAMCISTQKIQIEYINARVYVDGRLLNNNEVNRLAYNDGFYSGYELLNFFGKDFIGKIIHWTTITY